LEDLAEDSAQQDGARVRVHHPQVSPGVEETVGSYAADVVLVAVVSTDLVILSVGEQVDLDLNSSQ